MSNDEPRQEPWGHDEPLSRPPWEVDLVTLLQEYETKGDREACVEILRVLIKEHKCRDDAEMTKRLWSNVRANDSFFSAVALHGTDADPTAGDIRTLVHHFLEGRALLKRYTQCSDEDRQQGWYKRAADFSQGDRTLYVSPVSPLALAPTSSFNTRVLLRAVQHIPKGRPYSDNEDHNFRKWAAVSLTSNRESFDKLLSVLLRTSDPRIVSSIIEGIPELAPPRVLRHYRLDDKESRSKRIYQLARQRLGFGKLSSLWLAYPPRKRHRQFFDAVKKGLPKGGPFPILEF